MNAPLRPVPIFRGATGGTAALPVLVAVAVAVAACSAVHPPVHPLKGSSGTAPRVERDRRIAVTGKAKRPAWTRAVAKLTLRDRKGRLEQGSAVLVSPRLAITAHHCVARWNGKALLRFGYDGVARTRVEERTAIEIVAKSVAGDWAILRLDKPIKTITPLEPSAKKFRDCDTKRMRLAGYSCDNGNGLGGRVLTYDDRCKMKKLRTAEGRILTDAICYDGSSGGPAFVKDKDSDRWHWQGIVQGNINADSKSGRTTYAVYQVLYLRSLREAIAKHP